MPAFIALKYSCTTSLIVGSDSFMVNCCALAGAAMKAPAARMPQRRKPSDRCVHVVVPP